MATFRDDKDREWTLRLDFAKARSLREACGLDFVDFDGILATFAKIDASLDTLMQVVSQLTAAQREARKLPDSEFDSGFSGESFEAARAALEECALNFSPPREREHLARALKMQSQLRQTLVAGAVEKLSAATGGS